MAENRETEKKPSESQTSKDFGSATAKRRSHGLDDSSADDSRRRKRRKRSKETDHSSSSSSFSSDRERRKKRRKHKHSKKKDHEKRSERDRRKKKKKKKRSRRDSSGESDSDRGDKNMRSIITGKRIKLKIEKTEEDLANEKAREQLLEFMNSSYK